MTESEWWAETDTESLVSWLFFDAFACDRKLRLFSVACCDRVRHLISDPECRQLVEFAEAFADGLVGDYVLLVPGQGRWQRHETRIRSTLDFEATESAHFACLCALTRTGERNRADYERHRGTHDSWWCSRHAANAIGGADPLIDLSEYRARSASERAQQVRLLYDIFGPLPFRDIVPNPAWLTSDVLALARGIYDEKAFDRMLILADALQDAGCESADILAHCRAEGLEHVRGCWVLDLLLGRPWREEPATR